jgi:hypothetical protein
MALIILDWFLRFLVQSRYMTPETIASPRRPPIMPPTIAPVLVLLDDGFCGEGAGAPHAGMVQFIEGLLSALFRQLNVRTEVQDNR